MAEAGNEVSSGHTYEQGPSSEKGLAGKYMIFKLAEEEYGLGILNLREIIALQDITKVPKTPTFIRGVINLRGKVHPVVDLRLKLGMDKTESTDQTVIMVVHYNFQGQENVMGVLVDEVLEVLNVEAGEIEPPPNFGAVAEDTDFILGIGKSAERVIFLLDIAKVLSSADVQRLSGVS